MNLVTGEGDLNQEKELHDRGEKVKVSVVVVSYNTRDLLERCLNSILDANSDTNSEVIVVDNASADGSLEMIRSRFPQVHLIQNEVNVGFAKANNKALLQCSGEYILLLNSDARLLTGSLRRLVEYLDHHPNIGAAGPKIVDPKGRLRVLSCGYQPTLRRVCCQSLFLSTLFPRSRFFQGINLRIGANDDRPREVEWLSGACLLVRHEVVDEVGPLSEQWFMYAEDLEWCGRMVRKGWKLFHIPSAVAEHELGGSSTPGSVASTMWLRSLYSYYRWRSGASRMRMFFFAYVLHLGFLLRAVAAWFLSVMDRSNGMGRGLYARQFWAYSRSAFELAIRGESCKGKAIGPEHRRG